MARPVRELVRVERDTPYIFLRYCPPTSNIAAVNCPRLQYFVASISTSNIFSFLIAAFPLVSAVSVVPPQRPLRRDFAPSSLRLQIQFMVHILRRYCPPTSNIACVNCPSEQYLHASIKASNMFWFFTAAS